MQHDAGFMRLAEKGNSNGMPGATWVRHMHACSRLLQARLLMQLVVLGTMQMPCSKQQHSDVFVMVCMLRSAVDCWSWSCSAAGAAHSRSY
jgi:hypothetical protein